MSLGAELLSSLTDGLAVQMWDLESCAFHVFGIPKLIF